MEETPLQEILAYEAQLRAELAAEETRLQAEEQAAQAAAEAEVRALETELSLAGEQLWVAACAEGAAIQATELQTAEAVAARRAAADAERLRKVLRRHLPRLLPEVAP